MSSTFYIQWQNISLTSLMLAGNNDHINTVTVLLEAGADIDAKYKNGSTALIQATGNGHTEIVDLLKKAGGKE